MSELGFSKVIVARNSPKNGCHAPDEALLIVEPLPKIPQKTVIQHDFIALLPKRPKSTYGWVRSVPPFTFDEFVRANLGGRVLTEEQSEHLRAMLDSIQKLPDGTPVTAVYRSRGVIERSMRITVHKVVFYAGGKTG